MAHHSTEKSGMRLNCGHVVHNTLCHCGRTRRGPRIRLLSTIVVAILCCSMVHGYSVPANLRARGRASIRFHTSPILRKARLPHSTQSRFRAGRIGSSSKCPLFASVQDKPSSLSCTKFVREEVEERPVQVAPLVEDGSLYVQVPQPEDLRLNCDTSLLDPLSYLCADVLYDAPHLAGSVARDFVARYGRYRANRGVVVAVLAKGVGDELYKGDRVVGCVGLEVVLMHSDGRPEQPPQMGFFDAALAEGNAVQEVAENRPLISNLCVSSSFRRRGVARVLMDTCEAEVVGMGFDHVFVKVEATNEPAIALYKSGGYVEVCSLNEDKFVVSRDPIRKGIWVPTVNICLRKELFSTRAEG